MLLLLAFMYDAAAATRNQCRTAMVVNEVQSLYFGDYDGTTGGTIIVGTDNSWNSPEGIILLRGTPHAGQYEVSSGIPGCGSYQVQITYQGNPRLTGPGARMPYNNFVSDPASGFSISGQAITTVNIGATLVSPAAQTEGPYVGTYTVKFTFQ